MKRDGRTTRTVIPNDREQEKTRKTETFKTNEQDIRNQ